MLLDILAVMCSYLSATVAAVVRAPTVVAPEAEREGRCATADAVAAGIENADSAADREAGADQSADSGKNADEPLHSGGV